MTESIERLKAFAYLDAEKTHIYRQIMLKFLRAKEAFGIHLRPSEIHHGMQDEVSLTDIESALEQLCQWGNLEKHADTTDVTTVEDFYRPRYLYQLTVVGEAAERAIETYYAVVERPGELQTAALADIRAFLGELEQLAVLDEPDPGKVHRTMIALRGRLDALTENALTFIGSLQRNVDLLAAGIDEFLVYKEKLIGYIDRFISELALATTEIASAIERIEDTNVRRILKIAGERDVIDALDQTDAAKDVAVQSWELRWHGLRAWFIGESGALSQGEMLRTRARSSIRALLIAAAAINDRRTSRSDRVSDLRTLALWFSQSEADGDAHRLWRAAFGLTPARHLKIDDATLDEFNTNPVSGQTSWFDAPPIEISPRLRATGQLHRPGAPKAVVDFSREKEQLAREAAAEAEQIMAAHRRFATGQPIRLSEMMYLDHTEFGLLLDLLGEALASRISNDEPVEATSTDGTTIVSLLPTLDSRQAVIETSSGVFSGPDHIVVVRSSFLEETT